ncbi:MAG TPA: hypothetical protein VFR19_09455 [Hyphomicrobiaceae bacterium]|nr:hypothetical protein [Hyphomicrobiaceae bacterium]
MLAAVAKQTIPFSRTSRVIARQRRHLIGPLRAASRERLSLLRFVAKATNAAGVDEETGERFARRGGHKP